MERLIINRRRRADIIFSHSGGISITARLCRLLGLRPGDSINILQRDGEYLLFVAARHSDTQPPALRRPATCFATNRAAGHLRTSCAALARAILQAAGIPDAPRAAFFAGTPVNINGTPHVPIITRNPLI